MKQKHDERNSSRIYLYIIGVILTAAAIPAAHGQGVSQSHDAAKMNQITVAEIGSGSLTPELYYQLLHDSYRKSAAAKNKLSFRTQAGINLYNQQDDAEALDSALTKRAEVEALNVADRSGGALDAAWLAEGNKITAKLADFERNIRRILQVGGTASEQEHWKEYYQVYQCAIKATQDAYMPNAQRKKQYLRIHADLVRKNETLVRYLVRLSHARTTAELLAATYAKDDRKPQIVVEAMNRWRNAGWTVTTNGE